MAIDRAGGELAPHHDSSDASEDDQESDETAPFGRSHNSRNDPADLWDVLGNPRRRETVRYITTRDDVKIGDLSTHIACIENDCSVDQLDAQQRKRVYIAMLQNHLPLLDESDFVDWGGTADYVTRGDEYVTAHQAVESVADIAAGEFRRESGTEAGLVGSLKATLWGSA